MLKTRKIFKKYVYFIILVLAAFIVVLHIYTGSDDCVDNKFKIEAIEEGIKSEENHGFCKIPDLPIDNPEIMKFYENTPKLDCGNPDDDWVICEKSKCFIKSIVIKRKGEISCSFTDLIRKSDYKVRYGKTTRTNSYYILQQSDFAKVLCKAANGDRWFGFAIGSRDNIQRPINTINPPLLNVLMLGFDSLSKNAFIRKLPNTYSYLINVLKSHVLQGYNIVGDGTPQALIPILTGHNELELPEVRKRKKNSNYVDTYPMIWKSYEKYGYITSFNEDLSTIGTFTYRLNGFNNQPTDHYMRTYYLEIDNYLSSFSQFCINQQPSHQFMLNYTRNIMLKYTKNPRFIFSFHGELSHDSINLIGAADNDLKNWLIDLRLKNVLNNTILIVMSDHGNRFADVRNTLQGKQEERLPFFSFTFPNWFKIKYTEEYRNFLLNINRLTTPFDIHETLVDILRIQSFNEPINDQKRAISLFKSIPKSRSCADAYIEPHWCACLSWKQLNDTNSSIIEEVANSVVNKINDYTNLYRSMCAQLELKEINWAMKLSPHDDLLKFKQNKDFDGYLADLTSQTKVNSEIYQIKITVTPGNSIFEASVTHNIKDNKFEIKLSNVSRVNKYGNQAICIYDNHPELRKYCFCKTKNGI